MKVALLTDQISRAAGGPAVSVPTLARHISAQRLASVRVFGVEDPRDHETSAALGELVSISPLRRPRQFFYAPKMHSALVEFNPDIVDVQGLWTHKSYVNYLHFQRTGTPYVVTPRGMLDPWARSRSKLKKSVVRWLFEDTHLRNAHCLRATAEIEAEHFRSIGLTAPIAIVPNGVEVPVLSDSTLRREGGARRMLFLSRMHPKKGVDTLLQAWATLESSCVDWELVISGPDEVGYTESMKALAHKLDLKRVRWLGPVYGQCKQDLFRSSDLFVLPSYGENFGMVIAEALAQEVPVVTTRNTPWAGLHKHDCGWWIDLSVSELRDALEQATATPRVKLSAMGVRGRNWMQRDFGWKKIGQDMAQVYEWILNRGPRPACVI